MACECVWIGINKTTRLVEQVCNRQFTDPTMDVVNRSDIIGSLPETNADMIGGTIAAVSLEYTPA